MLTTTAQGTHKVKTKDGSLISGRHIIDISDGGIGEGIRIVDVRHEQTAVHAL